jgi:hypothetical protein
MPRPTQIPSYTLHRSTGQARVRIEGRDHYLGPFGSPESRQAYARLISERFRPGAGPSPAGAPSGYPDLSINELCLRYLQFAATYYQRDQQPGGEFQNMKDTIRSLRTLYESQPAVEFGPLALKASAAHDRRAESVAQGD